MTKEEKVLDALPATAAQIRHACGISEGAVSQALKALRAAGKSYIGAWHVPTDYKLRQRAIHYAGVGENVPIQRLPVNRRLRNGRPIGARTIEACELVEQHGATTCQALAQLMRIEPKTAVSYLTRSRGHGFMSVDMDTWPRQYSIVEGWRKLAEIDVSAAPAIARPKPAKPEWTGPRVNSIFNMGAMA